LGGCEKFLKFLAPRKTAIPLAALPSLSQLSPRFLPDFSPFSPYFLSAFSPLFSLCVCLSRAWTGILSDLMFGFAGTDEVEGDI